MNQIKKIIKQEYISNALLALIFLYPFLPFNFVSILIISLTLAAFFETYINKTFNVFLILKKIKYSVFFVTALSITLLYTEDMNSGINNVLKVLPFVLLPIIFSLKRKINQHTIKNYLLIFITSNFIFIILIFIYFLNNFFFGCYYEMSLLPFYIKLKYLFKFPFYNLMWCSEKVNVAGFFVHKVYNSMHLLFCIVSIYFLLKTFKFNKFIKIVLVLFLLIFTSSLISMASLVNMFLLLLITIIVLWYELKKIRHVGKPLFFILFILIFVLMSKLLNFQFLSKETKWMYNIEQKKEAINNFTDVEPRFYINSCTIEIIKNNFLFGVGIGDFTKQQLSCYKSRIIKNSIYKDIYKEELNPHNQYLTYFSAGGLFLMVSFLAVMFNGLKRALLQKHYYYLLFLLIISINLLFESMFIRMFGVLFFCLFNSLLQHKEFYLRLKKI